MAEERSEKRAEGRRPLWKSKVVLAAGVVTAIGLAMWIYALVSAPGARPAPSGVDSSLVSGLGGTARSSEGGVVEKSERLIDAASPALLRFGLSFLVGCILAYVFKKFIKLSLLIAGLAAAVVFGLQKSGVINIDGAAIKGHVDQSLAWAKGEAAGFKDFVVGYLPSSVSACAGLVYGALKG
ncbi:MAG: hypothetical protein IT436_07085 [Phycisphaerales bacterium]|nr:hypothetical protein [Phycisphaerales bacterium]